MKTKHFLSFALSLMLLLSGCSSASSQTSMSAQESSVSESTLDESQSETEYDRRSAINRPEVGTDVVIDPPYDFDPAEMLPSDFGDFFTDTESPTTVSSYLLGEGTDIENEVVVLEGEAEGPTVYVVAGVHGDETAGWSTGNLLKKIHLKSGKLCILSPANRWGAYADDPTRYVTGKEDLNRSFPGDANGSMAERVADSIYRDIEKTNPVFLFDLHEARYNAENYDFLGSSLIYTSLDGMEDLYLDLLMATEIGEICSERFNFYGPGPNGSINNTVTTNLEIPTITVETYRGYQLERRISDQLDIVQYVLRYYGLV